LLGLGPIQSIGFKAAALWFSVWFTDKGSGELNKNTTYGQWNRSVDLSLCDGHQVVEMAIIQKLDCQQVSVLTMTANSLYEKCKEGLPTKVSVSHWQCFAFQAILIHRLKKVFTFNMAAIGNSQGISCAQTRSPCVCVYFYQHESDSDEKP